MAGAPPPPEIGLLAYPQAQLAAIHGLTDLFVIADRLARKRLGKSETLLRVSHLSLCETDGRVVRTFDTSPGAGGEPVVVILPPSLGDPAAGENRAGLVDFLKVRYAAGTVLASVCAGAFLLAETGLLNGRAATTHWTYADDLAQRFPDVQVDTNKLIIDDGDIITAGGLMAWTDLGLKLVDRLLGSAMMIETARFLLVDPPGREQRYYSIFSPRLGHGDAAILKVQHWLQKAGLRDITACAMAAKAGLEERTFLRRFRKATGLKPTEYCQHLRVDKAREMLEATTRPIDQIAWDVGYDDPGSFRKVFIKVIGLAPGDYRRRFGAETTSAHSP
ncbi:GlxA family transcriptional regulator [Beijerinckia indica]|uniref:Transcriptional regulator, AraC family n=1 Tax=Beijerinckia indica subsp. indica (strain ATCC 9039 / DSM 1715 / NCIMB 8712) TaxID=395963 RepID=B2IJL6_BEII9|nr:GlxA family transcriptional regulator [Beijerinckia indica]ACB94888.1 transcriptional regulator, AraC family [Beijerinckia indica subsp. indica ATCC 9039]